MGTKKIILKTAKARKGTVSRAAIRKAVQTVFNGSKALQSPPQAAKGTGLKRVSTSVLQAQ